VNPVEAEDIREELRSHLDAIIQERLERGLSEAAATDFAIASVGDPVKLHGCLDRVHQGDAWWVLRLKGLVFGMLTGGLLALLIPLGGHLEFAARFISFPAAVDPDRLPMLLNGLIAGGAIGLLAAGGGGVLIGWSAGAVLWLAEYVIYWMAQAVGGDASSAGNMLERVLLAPLLGGVFGAAVGAASSAVLAAASRFRPRVQ
jgi:hypothetical protein